MKSVNLYLLTRVRHPETMSLLFRALSRISGHKMISPHEAASLCALTDFLTDILPGMSVDSRAKGAKDQDGGEPWLSLLDGFFFSYVIEHIGKEFDLLKISSDGSHVLNIELKSEDIGEERIKKQLEQNRYYLSHTAGTIDSFTYVMDTNVLYQLNDKGYLRRSSSQDLIRALKRTALQDFLREDIDRFFRSSDYLISPVAAPEKFLQGQYFLTNQQFDFKRRILEGLKKETSREAALEDASREAALEDASRNAALKRASRYASPVIAISGSAGTGKTLLLFDLAMQLSTKNRVLLLHAGTLRYGHLLLDKRLKNVDIRAADDALRSVWPGAEDGVTPEHGIDLADYKVILADEADHLKTDELECLLKGAEEKKIPVVLAYDPHELLDEQKPQQSEDGVIERIRSTAALSFSFSGNIRINRPVYSFLRTMLRLKEPAGRQNYDCIDVLYVKNREELDRVRSYYVDLGYEWIREEDGRSGNNPVIAQEYEKVLLVMDESFYYNDELCLCVRDREQGDISLLYEALSRTREKLCLIIMGDEKLFSRILEIRLNQV